MADNVTFQTSVTATPPNATTVATDDVGGVQYQRVKIDIGGDGATSPVTILNPMPIGTLPGGTVIVSGTVQALGSIQGVGTFQVLGTVQVHGTAQALGTFQPLAGSVHLASGTVTVLGTIQAHGTTQALGTVQPLAGSVHLASNLPGGSINAQGVVAHGAAAAGNPILFGGFGSSGTQAAVDDGDLTRLWTDLNGRLQIRGTIDSMPTVSGTVQTHGTSHVLGTVQTHGTSQALGTVQPLAGSVHVANTISGTVQTHGTSQVLGTTQPLAGSVHVANAVIGSVSAQGYVAHDAAAAGNPVLFGAFGSSGTQAAVSDGDAVRLWADLNGRLQIRGTIDSMPAIEVAQGTIPGGTIQIHGTAQVLGTVRALTEVTVTVGTIAEGTINSVTGTVQVLGSVQPLLGTMVSIGSVAHGAAADSRPVLFGGFGSSGTQAAVDDGDMVRAWFDLNGRQIVRGTIDSIPSITIGAALPAGNNNIGDVDVASMPTVTVQATNLDIRDLSSASDSVAVVGTVQTHGTSQVIGTVQTHGTSQVIGTVQAHGSIQALGTLSVQGFFAHDAAGVGNPVSIGGLATRARPGTVAVNDSVQAWFDQQGRQVVQVGAGTTEVLGTIFVGAAANGTIHPGGGAGSFMRIYDILISGSAAGTVRLLENTTVRWGPVFLAANGGWNANSAVGYRLNTANSALVASFTAGTWAITINYGFEGV